MSHVRLVETRQLSTRQLRLLRQLLDEAFAADFTEDDWQHALGGWHAIIESADRLLAHAAVVERRLVVDGREFRTGYVEAAAVTPDLQRTGLGTTVMTAISDLVRQQFDLGGLSTGEWAFYQRLGWERWEGPTYVRTADGRLQRTPDEDAGVMVLRCGPTRDLNLKTSIACEERSGDSW
jgi:aminoglycoside 2'-N-acetyltransferase I